MRKSVGLMEKGLSEERDENDAVKASESGRNVLRSSSRRMQKQVAYQRHRPKRTSKLEKERKKSVRKKLRSFFVDRKDPMRMLFWIMVLVLVLVGGE